MILKSSTIENFRNNSIDQEFFSDSCSIGDNLHVFKEFQFTGSVASVLLTQLAVKRIMISRFIFYSESPHIRLQLAKKFTEIVLNKTVVQIINFPVPRGFQRLASG